MTNRLFKTLALTLALVFALLPLSGCVQSGGPNTDLPTYSEGPDALYTYSPDNATDAPATGSARDGSSRSDSGAHPGAHRGADSRADPRAHRMPRQGGRPV